MACRDINEGVTFVTQDNAAILQAKRRPAAKENSTLDHPLSSLLIKERKMLANTQKKIQYLFPAVSAPNASPRSQLRFKISVVEVWV
jgi:hypothetical protein